MSIYTYFTGNLTNRLLSAVTQTFTVSIRNAVRKPKGCTKNAGNAKPKYRGIKKHESKIVPAGSMLVTQTKSKFFPGLNVGFGRNGTLYAIYPGRVKITCEKTNVNFDHAWVKKDYPGREGVTFYKKYFNVIPEPQHKRFKLIDTI